MCQIKSCLLHLILDTAAFCSVFDYLPALTPTGTYVLVGGDMNRLFQAMLLGPWLTDWAAGL